MTKELATVSSPPSAEIIEKVIMSGDLSGLTSEHRLAYYKYVCETLHLNPLTKPFDYITLDGKLTLYATKDCAAQLRKRQKISIGITSRERQDSVYLVTASAELVPAGGAKARLDESLGAVSIINKEGKHLQGTALANAIMKAETKAKRRVTLSICGLGMLDEGEVEDPMLTDGYDQRSTQEIIERNVREATANTTGDTVAADPFPFDLPCKVDIAKHNEYGPLEITQGNYKELVSHVGQAQGNLLGKKVGELSRNIIEWMYNKWRGNLRPTASDQDLRLKNAIELAYSELEKPTFRETGEKGDITLTTPDGRIVTGKISEPKAPMTPEKAETILRGVEAADVGAKAAAIADLRGRIEDLAITEAKAMEYLRGQGLSNQNWQSLDDMPESMLLVLCTPKQWAMFKGVVEADLKPKPPEPKPRMRRTRK